MRAVMLMFVGCRLLARADFPTPYDSQKDDGKRMSAAEVAATWRVPEGFKVSVFAAEPDVQQPIAACWDPRGRLWVAENYTYAQAGVEFDLALNDRIVIFEDKDNDGKHDTRAVFADNLKMLTSVELGGGGVYALCPPQLLWIPVKDDKPSGPPVVLLDGFDTVKGNRHTFANGLKWGPDGWLYGRVGISSPCRVGAPGCPEEGRVRMRGGIWRFHPTRKVFEAVCHGTTNPWGMDWNEDGEGFFTNTVIGHVWHMIPGAHFKRMHGEDVNPRCYEFIDQIADHYHFDTGKGWTSSRNAGNGSDELGGGHAHCGALIYKGTNWPQYWRGKLLTLNLHGRRINVERLERNGCTYVAKHEPDAFHCPDPWFRGIDLLEGPDGGVFVLDWSDTGECHEHDGVHRGSGRIYKITFGTPPAGRFDLGLESNEILVQRVRMERGWSSTMASRQLHQRLQSVDTRQATLEAVRAVTDGAQTSAALAPHLLRMSTFGADGEFDLKYCAAGLASTNEYLRANVLRSIFERVPNVMNAHGVRIGGQENDPKILELAAKHLSRESAPFVLLRSLAFLGNIRATISAIKMIPEISDEHQRLIVLGDLSAELLMENWRTMLKIVHSVAVRVGDEDKVAGLLLWQLMAETAEARPKLWYAYATSDLPDITLGHFARLVAERVPDDLTLANAFIASMERFSRDEKRLVVDALNLAWQGRRNVPKPKHWDVFVALVTSDTSDRSDSSDELKALLQRISTRFGGQASFDEFREIARDGKRDSLTRNQALQSLVEARAEGLHELCKKLVGESSLAATAARGLALSEDPAVGPLLAGRYKWSDSAKPVFLEVLASRPVWAKALLEAMAKGDIAAKDLPVFLARQIAALPDEAVRAKLKEVWGEVRADSAEARRKIAGWKVRLTAEELAKADPEAGRKVFEQSCAVCHKLFGAGGEIGPDLTGGGRRNLDYLLDNVVDPSAVVANEHRVSVVTLRDGRVLNGSLSGRSEPVHTLRTLAGVERIAREDVRSVEDLPFSLMPEGLLDALSAEQVRDLVGYLMR